MAITSVYGSKSEGLYRAALVSIMRAGDLGISASLLGEELWGKAYRLPQHYARPAGKLLKRMESLGLVRMSFIGTKGRPLWVLSADWERNAYELGCLVLDGRPKPKIV